MIMGSQALQHASAVLTYMGQTTGCYCLILVLCKLLPNARVRQWLWTACLALTSIVWASLILRFAAGNFASWTVPIELARGSGVHWAYELSALGRTQVQWLGMWAVRGYVTVLALSIVQLLLRGMRLRTLLRSGKQASAEMEAIFRGVCQKMRVPECRLRLIPQLRSPAMACWFRPWVLLPCDLLSHLNDNELTHVLSHELMHVRRRDYLWDRLAAIACRLVFFHPVVWLAYRHLRRDRELACDHAIAGSMPDRRVGYAECLTRLAKWCLAESGSAEGIGFSASASFLATRVHLLLEEAPQPSRWQTLGRSGIVATAASAGMYFLAGISLTLYWASPRPLGSEMALTRAGNVYKHSASHRQVRTSMREIPANAGHNGSSSDDIAAEFEGSPVGLHASGAEKRPEDAVPGDQNSTSLVSHGGTWDEGSIQGARVEAPTWRDVVGAAVRVGVGLARDHDRPDSDGSAQPTNRSAKPPGSR